MLMAIHFCIDITLRHHRRRLRNKRASLFLRNIGLTRKLMEVRGLRYQKYITAYGFSTPAFFKADTMLGQRRRCWPSIVSVLSYYRLQLRILLPEWTLVPDFAWFIWHQIQECGPPVIGIPVLDPELGVNPSRSGQQYPDLIPDWPECPALTTASITHSVRLFNQMSPAISSQCSTVCICQLNYTLMWTEIGSGYAVHI